MEYEKRDCSVELNVKRFIGKKSRPKDYMYCNVIALFRTNNGDIPVKIKATFFSTYSDNELSKYIRSHSPDFKPSYLSPG